MSTWTTPKTNWNAGDGVSDADMNRIEGNTQWLQDNSGPKGTSVQDSLLTSTAATTIATFTPVTQTNAEVGVYIRVVAATTNVTISVTYTSASGSQTYTMLSTTALAVGDHSFIPYFFNATAAAITVTVTAGTANQVYASTSITQR